MSQTLAGVDNDIVTMAPDAAATHARLLPLADLARTQWEALAADPLDPNGFFDPGFSLNSAVHAHHGGGAQALAAYSAGRLVGLVPVMTASRALKLPIPALISTQPYNSLTTPLLDKQQAERAAGDLIDAAAASGASLLVLQMVAMEGPAFDALSAAIAARWLEVVSDNVYERAALSTDLDDETYLRSGMGSKSSRNSAARATGWPMKARWLPSTPIRPKPSAPPSTASSSSKRAAGRASAGPASASIRATQGSCAPWPPTWPRAA
ncbi:MAG TPA: hypothetical protein VGD86_03270, partial [Devosia sp.]